MPRHTKPTRPIPLRATFLLLLAPLLLTGCDYGILLAYLIGGPPSIEPAFSAETGKDMDEHGVTVAVICTAPRGLKFTYNEVDHTVAEAVTFQLHQKGIEVIVPDVVQAWLDHNPDWTTPREIGEAMGVNYVIHINMHSYSLYEKNSATLYRGRSEYEVNVWEMLGEGEGEKIYSSEDTTVYPLRIHRSAQDTSLEQFKKEYLYRLSFEIGRQFFEYYAGDDIGDAT